MNYSAFVEGWDSVVFVLIFVGIGVAIINYILYWVLYTSKKTYKEKYDFVSEKEVKFLMNTHIAFSLALFFFNNTLENDTVLLSPLWFFVRIFVSACISLLYVYITHLILKFYYPGRIENKLKKLRYMPRINPKNGNKMKLLSEKEEDAYLDEGMQSEENLFSVDYDVWIDEQTGFTKIEKYKGFLSALQCDRCHFHTLRMVKEEIVKKPTAHAHGELTKEYVCSYCNRKKKKSVVLYNQMSKQESESDLLVNRYSEDKKSKTAIIKIEIYGADDKMHTYEFSDLEKAKNFLEEFNFTTNEQVDTTF